MAKEIDKNRAAEYVPAGPVRIRSTSMAPNPIGDLKRRVEVLEAQVASLHQLAAAKGIPVMLPCRAGCECLRCGGHKKP